MLALKLFASINFYIMESKVTNRLTQQLVLSGQKMVKISNRLKCANPSCFMKTCFLICSCFLLQKKYTSARYEHNCIGIIRSILTGDLQP